MINNVLRYGLPLLLLLVVGFFLIDYYTAGSYQPDQNRSDKQKKGSPTFIGKEACFECHKKEYDLWKNSHHDLAMQVADKNTILGDFNNTTYTHFGVTSTFFKKDDKYYVNTEGDDAQLLDYKIAYTFGITPLQQYLVKFPDGRIQTLPFCWDTRPGEQGGQRWFHIYPNEKITPNDILFWTRMNQNWNYMCSECHSTNVKKNYDYKSKKYNTTFSEINVSCEACHGPGSSHVEWAKEYEKDKKITVSGDLGLVARLKDPNEGVWIFPPSGEPVAERTVPLTSQQQIETCAICHSRRSALTDDYVYGQPILDSHRLPVLDEQLYFPDGQIKEEVYVYHSFLQSKMFTKGVVCSDCHEPHSMKVYNDNNALCFRCHLPQNYDTKTHHFHKPEDRGGSCIDCHMPERTYMVIDPRRDHSIRVPRPDLSERLQTPNACNQCHQDKSIQWATEYMIKWYGPDLIRKPHYGEIIEAAQRGLPRAGDGLRQLVLDKEQPNMVKATALSLLSGYPGEKTSEIIQAALYNDDPLLRTGALDALFYVDQRTKFNLSKHLLGDPIRSIRIRTAYLLSDLSSESMTGFDQSTFESALSEYIESQLFNADRPSALNNLAIIFQRKGDPLQAESVYKDAIDLEPAYVYSYINLADLYRSQEKDKEGEVLLQQAIQYNPNSADLYHALGLLLTRAKRRTEALGAFEKAVILRPEDEQLQYYQALALIETGRPEEAIEVLEQANKINPFNQDVLFALITICRDNGKLNTALNYARKLYELVPQSQSSQQLLNQIQGMIISQP